MKNWTIRSRIIGSFGVVLALMIVMAGVAYTRLARIDAETRALRTDSLPGVLNSTAILDLWSDNFLLLEEYALQPDQGVRTQVLAKLTNGRRELDKAIDSYEHTATSPEDRRLFEVFKDARAAYARAENDLLKDASVQKGQQEATARIEGQLTPAFDAAESAIQAVVALNQTDS